MSSEDNITELKADFEAPVSDYEQDQFTTRILDQLGAQRRKRVGIIFFASGLGAALAVTQIGALLEKLTPLIAETTLTTMLGFSPQWFTSMAFAALLAITVGLVRHES